VKLGVRRPALTPDADVIRALAGLLSETGLSEIEYAIGDHRIRVARDSVGNAAAAHANDASPATNGHKLAVVTPEPVLAPPSAVEPPAKNAADHPGTLTSPIVGIAYLAPEPGAAPFVKIGDMISEGQTLLIIEAMKVMNQIRARRAGRITRIFVEDAGPVEYGAPLLLIE
jgi:acetyl-CoA carboxylase biotin carboxyl carrier protein